MKAVFVELPAFERNRAAYLDDDGFAELQKVLMANPEAGDVIPGAGGLRKCRFGDSQRSSGKRGGLRVIYFWWEASSQFWLFTLFGKREMPDLTKQQRETLAKLLKTELRERRRR